MINKEHMEYYWQMLRDVATDIDVKPQSLWGVFRALVKYEVIQRVRYSNEDAHKRAVYRVVKD